MENSNIIFYEDIETRLEFAHLTAASCDRCSPDSLTVTVDLKI